MIRSYFVLIVVLCGVPLIAAPAYAFEILKTDKGTVNKACDGADGCFKCHGKSGCMLYTCTDQYGCKVHVYSSRMAPTGPGMAGPRGSVLNRPLGTSTGPTNPNGGAPILLQKSCVNPKKCR